MSLATFLANYIKKRCSGSIVPVDILKAGILAFKNYQPDILPDSLPMLPEPEPAPKLSAKEKRKKVHYCEHSYGQTLCHRQWKKVRTTCVPDLRVVNCKTCAKKIKQKREAGKRCAGKYFKRIGYLI